MIEADTSDRLAQFADAWTRLDLATQLRADLLAGWSALGEADPWGIEVLEVRGGSGRLDVSCWWPPKLAQEMDATAARFVQALKSCLDAAVAATAATVCRALGHIDEPQHLMPLETEPSRFDDLVNDGRLMGLRPDQVRLLRMFQPFPEEEAADEFVALHLRHLTSMLNARAPGSRRLAVWASSAQPEVRCGGTSRVVEVLPTGDGLMDPTRTVATFRVEPAGAESLAANPNIGFDLVFSDPPYPLDADDNLGSRSRALLVIARYLVEGLQRSVSTPSLLQSMGPLNELAPAAADDPWLPVVFDDDAERLAALAAIAESDYCLATHRDGGGSLTLLRRAGGADEAVVGRVIPEASVVDPTVRLGTATETATLEVAKAWGLPDFVYRPATRAKGSGVREIGDGTIVSGGRGLSLQVKARETPTDDPVREAMWLTKKAAQAARQAAGTIRTFLDRPEVELVNERGRLGRFDGSAVVWAGVVVLDHPSPPSAVVPLGGFRVPTVVLLRRDWDFLWDQLRSASAVVDYVHRVAGDPPGELGMESLRYLELAHADLVATPAPPEAWMIAAGVAQSNAPLLPLEPAAASDNTGHAVFRTILNDIAKSSFDGYEGTRLETLAQIDRYSVGERAKLGRDLLTWLDACLLTPTDQTRWHHRTVIMERGRLHLAFSVCSAFSGYHGAIHTDWLLLRRSQLLAHMFGGRPIPEAEVPWTIGVLLTPRPEGDRFWDTTVAATNGIVTVEPEKVETLVGVWGELGCTGKLKT